MTMTVTEMISSIKNDILELNYLCKTKQVSYSIADYCGNVLMRGSYDCTIMNKLSITSLPKGMYMICVIDGDILSKARFEKN
jgi:hypothetical protein